MRLTNVWSKSRTAISKDSITSKVAGHRSHRDSDDYYMKRFVQNMEKTGVYLPGNWDYKLSLIHI